MDNFYRASSQVYCPCQPKDTILIQITAIFKQDSSGAHAHEKKQIRAGIDGEIGVVDIKGQDQMTCGTVTVTTDTTVTSVTDIIATDTVTVTVVTTMYAMLPNSYVYTTYSHFFLLIQSLLELLP
jgi:hypothetical protein